MSNEKQVPVSRRKQETQHHNPFVSLQEEIDRLFDNFARGFPSLPQARLATSEFAPKMDVSETDAQIEMTFEMPGLTKDDIEIDLADNVLTVRGEKKSERDEKDEKRNYRLIERSYGAFSRSIELPAGVDPDTIDAKVADGVLTVTVPKPEPAKTKRIGIKAS